MPDTTQQIIESYQRLLDFWAIVQVVLPLAGLLAVVFMAAWALASLHDL